MKAYVKRIASRAKQELLYLFPVTKPRRILFDHLPKCGGSSLDAYLKPHYLKRKVFSTNSSSPAVSVDEFRKFSQRERYGYDLVKGHLSNELLDYVNPECLKVTVFREPVVRIVSHYYYAKRSPAHYLHSKIHESRVTLEDYAAGNLSNELRNWYTAHFSGMAADDVEKDPEESLSRATETILKRYDVIGFLDDIESFIEALRKQANLRYEYLNMRINVTQDRPSLDNVEQSVIQKIEQVNRLDVALYRRIRNATG